MSRTTINSTVIDALERFEVCLQTPLVPGELENWAGALRAAYRELSPALSEHLQTVHRPMLKQIATEDTELLCHTAEMKRADLETLETFDRLRQWIEQLPDIAAKIEPDEKRLEEHVGSLIHDGLEFVMHVRKQETVLSTWHQECDVPGSWQCWLSSSHDASRARQLRQSSHDRQRSRSDPGMQPILGRRWSMVRNDRSRPQQC